MMDMDIDSLLSIERFLPVLTKQEQDALVTDNPTLAQVQDWQQRLDLSTARIEEIFKRAYDKQIKGKGK